LAKYPSQYLKFSIGRTANIGHTSITALLHELGDLTHFFRPLLCCSCWKAEHLKGHARQHFYLLPPVVIRRPYVMEARLATDVEAKC